MPHTDIITAILAAVAPIVDTNISAISILDVRRAILNVSGVASVGTYVDSIFSGSIDANVELDSGECITVNLVEGTPSGSVARELALAIPGSRGFDPDMIEFVKGVASVIYARDLRIAALEAKLAAREAAEAEEEKWARMP